MSYSRNHINILEKLESRICLSATFPSALRHVISDTAGSHVVQVANIDGDEFADVVTLESWFKGSKNGDFSYGGPTVNGEQLWSMVVDDLDGDGDSDLVGISLRENTISWYENMDGLGRFGQQKVITTEAPSGRSLHVEDLDGDGDLDLLATWRENTSWFENTDGHATFGPPRQISDEVGGAHRLVKTADMDGDGDLDVVSASYWGLNWFENDIVFGRTVISTKAQEISRGRFDSIVPVDLDSDGDTDLVGGSAGDILLFTSSSNGTLFERSRIADIRSDISLDVADMDEDGDLDIISATETNISTGDELAWHENRTDGTFVSHVLRNGSSGFDTVVSADFDGDGDNDILAPFGRELAWYENRVHGDSNNDDIFSSSDLVRVFQAGKFEQAQPATYEEGDWNGDGLFTTEDLVIVFQEDTYEAAANEESNQDIAAAIDLLFSDRTSKTPVVFV